MNVQLKPVTNSWQDKAISILMIGAFLLLIVIMVGVFAAWSGAWTAADNSGQVARGNEIAACRSNNYGKVADASTTLQLASADLQVLLARGLSASVENDAVTLKDSVARINDATEQVLSAADQLSTATDTYVNGTSLAASDPDAFLAACHS